MCISSAFVCQSLHNVIQKLSNRIDGDYDATTHAHTHRLWSYPYEVIKVHLLSTRNELNDAPYEDDDNDGGADGELASQIRFNRFFLVWGKSNKIIEEGGGETKRERRRNQVFYLCIINCLNKFECVSGCSLQWSLCWRWSSPLSWGCSYFSFLFCWYGCTPSTWLTLSRWLS